MAPRGASDEMRNQLPATIRTSGCFLASIAKHEFYCPSLPRRTKGHFVGALRRYIFADPFEDPEAIHIREHEVEDDEVVVGGAGEFERRPAVGRAIDGVARGFETAAQEVRDALFVFHHQDAHLLLIYQEPAVRDQPGGGGL